MTRPLHCSTNTAARTLIIGVTTPLNRTFDADSYFEEFANLVHTNGVEYEDELFVKLRLIDPGYFFGKGKLTELKAFVEEHKIRHVIISEILTAQQERNLSTYLHCDITDRTRLILEIFEKSAHSAEGKAQVAIAKLKFEKSRLAGKGVHLSQQTGVKGQRGGAGETLKERETRHIENSITQLKKQLEKIQQARDTQRKTRLNNKIPHICLIGYTNAGKSTILNTLTKSDVLAEDKLFATLDTTTRKLFINGKFKGILSDTVGFIQQLPHTLIEAFKSTLSELQHADLLLHVIDISDSNWKHHINVVEGILQELNVDKPILYVFNKGDRLEESTQDISQLVAKYQPCVLTNALTKDGLTTLINFLEQWNTQPEEDVEAENETKYSE
jgi:GTP-binding protein HflX